MSAHSADPTCPVCATADIICGKWTILVIRDLAEGRSRFCELERSLAGISPRTLSLRLLADWGARTGGGEPYRHEPCGTALEARWWCPTCEEVVDDPGDEVVHV